MLTIYNFLLKDYYVVAMSFVKRLKNELDEYHLLKHSFYQDWQEGKLKIEDLQYYATQYFQQEKNFPRYLSSIHTQCDDIKTRQVILNNLVDEEKGEKNHPELWLSFSDALGMKREEVINAKCNKHTKELIKTFFRLCSSSVEEGLGAIFAYEYQIPDIARTKIEGLKEFYNISSKEAIEFFTTHIIADEWHAAEEELLIENLSPEKQLKTLSAAKEAAKSLWGFLDGINIERKKEEIAH